MVGLFSLEKRMLRGGILPMFALVWAAEPAGPCPMEDGGCSSDHTETDPLPAQGALLILTTSLVLPHTLCLLCPQDYLGLWARFYL